MSGSFCKRSLSASENDARRVDVAIVDRPAKRSGRTFDLVLAEYAHGLWGDDGHPVRGLTGGDVRLSVLSVSTTPPAGRTKGIR
jgi:hypothetical protein